MIKEGDIVLCESKKLSSFGNVDLSTLRESDISPLAVLRIIILAQGVVLLDKQKHTPNVI